MGVNFSCSSGEQQNLSFEVMSVIKIPGNFNGNLIISSNAGNMTIPYKFTQVLKPRPIIDLQERYLLSTKNTKDHPERIRIINSGFGDYIVNYSTNVNWLGIYPSTDRIGEGETRYINVWINAKELGEKQDVAELRLNSAAGTIGLKINADGNSLPNKKSLSGWAIHKADGNVFFTNKVSYLRQCIEQGCWIAE